jgi:hypothetical protein
VILISEWTKLRIQPSFLTKFIWPNQKQKQILNLNIFLTDLFSVSSSVFPNLGLLSEFLIVQMEFSKQKTFSLLSVLPPQFIFAKVSQKSVESFTSWCLNNKHTCRKPIIRILLSIFCLCIIYSPHFLPFSLNIFLFKSSSLLYICFPKIFVFISVF